MFQFLFKKNVVLQNGFAFQEREQNNHNTGLETVFQIMITVFFVWIKVSNAFKD